MHLLQHNSESCDDSLSNRSSSALREFSDIVDPSSDERDELSSMNTDPVDNNPASGIPIEMLPPLPPVDSFVSVIKLLPSLVLEEDNTYHIDGPLVEGELEKLVSYARRIRELILTDAAHTTPSDIAPETLARLALIQDPENPFLSSLECLRLIDADESLLYLFFCIVPSLKSLEISRVTRARQIVVSSFLKELVVKVPGLSNITLCGRVSDSSLQSSLRFTHLRQLHLVDAVESLEFAFLHNISMLPELESFLIDARTAQYKLANSSDLNPLSFRQLHKLTITGNVILMDDLISYLPPRAVKDVSLTLVRHLPESPTIGHIPGTDGQAEDPMYTMSIEDLRWISNQHPGNKIFGRNSAKKFKTKNGDEIRLTPQEEQRYRDHLNRLEQERASAIISQTSIFAGVIEKILAFEDLEAFSIDHADASSHPAFTEVQSGLFPFEFPSTTFETLLSYPSLKILKIAHWALPSMEKSIIESTMASVDLQTSLQRLELPVDKTSNTGITISTLNLIAHYYPRLIYLECVIQTPSAESLQLNSGADVIPHGLEVLSVSGEIPSTEVKISLATHLALLFPNLKDINTHEGFDEDDWKYIRALVKMCHTITLAAEKRFQ